ncbi:MAG TPA: glycosyltransferase family 4 protein, partial [Puia sp.]
MKNKKVIFSILDTPAFGGAEQYMYTHLKFLSESGFDVVLGAKNAEVRRVMNERLTEAEKKKFKIIRAPYRLDPCGNWKGLVKFFPAAPRALIWCYLTLNHLKKNYEQIICLWPGWADRSLFSPIAKHFDCPVIWIEFGTIENTYKRGFGFPKPLFQFFSAYADHLITSSEYTKKSIMKHSRFKGDNISLVYPGTKNFSKNELANFRNKAITWKKENKFDKTTFIGIIGRLAHENEIDMAIKAFALYKNKHQQQKIKLLIIGDGPTRSELEELVKELKIEKDIIFAGFVNEEKKYTLLSACTLFIFPRAWILDGFGMTTIEAMSLGLPVLTTDFGPQVEIVTDGREGFRYKPHDSKDLAKKI